MVNPQNEAGLGRNSPFIVGEPGAVGSANLAKTCTRFGENFRNSKAAANFDKLSAGDDDFVAFRQRIEREESSRGAVIDDDGGSGSVRDVATWYSERPQ